MALRSASGSLTPSARNDIAPEYTLSAFAQTAPSAIASSVTSASGVARWLVKPAVGLAPNLVLLVTVAAAAPTISSTTHDSKTPRPAHIPVALRSVSGGQVTRVVAGIGVPARRITERGAERDEPAADSTGEALGRRRTRVRLREDHDGRDQEDDDQERE